MQQGMRAGSRRSATTAAAPRLTAQIHVVVPVVDRRQRPRRRRPPDGRCGDRCNRIVLECRPRRRTGRGAEYRADGYRPRGPGAAASPWPPCLGSPQVGGMSVHCTSPASCRLGDCGRSRGTCRRGRVVDRNQCFDGADCGDFRELSRQVSGPFVAGSGPLWTGAGQGGGQRRGALLSGENSISRQLAAAHMTNCRRQ